MNNKTFSAMKLIESFNPDTSHISIGEAFGLSRSTIYKWQQRKIMLSVWQADKYAIKIGLHPSEVWHDWFELENTQ